MRLKGAEILIRSLIDHGVDTVFGYPGGQVLDIYDALYTKRRRIRHIITSHEEGACHAADGYARATGKAGVVIATSGPGATNLVTGIATAFLDSIPLVAITGNVTTSMMGKDSFQEVDIAGITMPITKYNYIVKDVSELENIVDDAFTIATSGRPGPVLIDVPKDIQRAWCEYNGGKSLRKIDAKTDLSAIDDVVSMISKAERPCLYIGGGVISSNSGDKILDFAKKIDAPIVSSMMALGAVPYDEIRFLGMGGMHGSYASNMAVSKADLLIALGCRFSDRATGDKSDYNRDKCVIHIDIDPAEVDKNIECTHYLIGDVGNIVDELTDKIPVLKHAEWMDLLDKIKSSCENDNSMDGDFTPDKIIVSVSSVMDDDSIVATDVGQHQIWTAQYYPWKKARTLLTSGGLGTMGYGLGAAIGGAIATNRSAVLFTSDGSFHMNMNEIATVATLNLPVLIVVFDNKALGMVKQWQHLFYKDRYSATETHLKTDYAALGKAMGIEGYNVCNMTELASALCDYKRHKKPMIIACNIASSEMALPMIPPAGSTEKIMLRHGKIK